jgi:hypothetical protein
MVAEETKDCKNYGAIRSNLILLIRPEQLALVYAAIKFLN